MLVFSKTYTTGIGFAPNISNNKISNILPYFVRSGNLSPHDGKSWHAGQGGLYWSWRGSSTRYDGTAIPSAYYLEFNVTGVYPSRGPLERWHGFPLRCLSTVLGM